MNLQKIYYLLQKDLKVEIRQKFALSGVFLFAVTVVFLIYKSFNVLPPREWTIMIWIIMLFAGINAVIKSFLQENKATYLYYYTLFDPIDIVLSKLIYNFVFLLLLFVIVVGVMTIFVGNPVTNFTLFWISSLAGILGLALVYTFVSMIASIEMGGSTLMSILSLPLVLPILLTMLKTSAVSVRLLNDTSIWSDVWMVMGIDFVLLGAILILFPTLWRS